MGVGLGDAVGGVVGLAVGCGVGLGDATARPLGVGAAAPAAMTPAPTPATAASPNAAMRIGRLETDGPDADRPEARGPAPSRGVAIRRDRVWRVATVPSITRVRGARGAPSADRGRIDHRGKSVVRR